MSIIQVLLDTTAGNGKKSMLVELFNKSKTTFSASFGNDTPDQFLQSWSRAITQSAPATLVPNTIVISEDNMVPSGNEI